MAKKAYICPSVLVERMTKTILKKEHTFGVKTTLSKDQIFQLFEDHSHLYCNFLSYQNALLNQLRRNELFHFDYSNKNEKVSLINEHSLRLNERIQKEVEGLDLSHDIEFGIEHHDFSEHISNAIGDYDFSDEISDAISNHDFSDELSDAIFSNLQNNYDFSNEISDAISNQDFSEHISSAIENYDFSEHISSAIENSKLLATLKGGVAEPTSDDPRCFAEVYALLSTAPSTEIGFNNDPSFNGRVVITYTTEISEINFMFLPNNKIQMAKEGIPGFDWTTTWTLQSENSSWHRDVKQFIKLCDMK